MLLTHTHRFSKKQFKIVATFKMHTIIHTAIKCGKIFMVTSKERNAVPMLSRAAVDYCGNTLLSVLINASVIIVSLSPLVTTSVFTLSLCSKISQLKLGGISVARNSSPFYSKYNWEKVKFCAPQTVD